MLNAIIRFALQQRMLTAAFAVFLLCYGTWQALHAPIDVFPDLNRPRVTIMTEVPGLAPEEVETLITFPIETAVNGASGVEVVRSNSGIGLSVVIVDFEWGTDIYTARQMLNERMQIAMEQMPEGVTPQLAPVSSIMGQILMLGIWSEDGSTSPMELRTTADWLIRQRLLTIKGVAQVFATGGDRKQYQVLVDAEKLQQFGVTLAQVKEAVVASNGNGTGGYLDQQGPNELLVRSLGRIQSIEELEQVVVTIRDRRPVPLSAVATVVEGAQVKRGDSSAFLREGEGFSGGPAVILMVNKQPGSDTRGLTDECLKAIEELKAVLPDDFRIEPVYSQKSFIDRAIENVMEALRDGAILVVIILFLFLMNLKTTFITLTAIPLSLVMTAIVFHFFGFSINTMTLGGLAVAIGELVDDAIVDVENIFRRLKENRHAAKPKHPLLVVYQASTEIRNSIVYSTMIVILVFVPLFALSGMEGRLFTPLGVAYIVSILASLLVSLTVTPVLSYWLLVRKSDIEAAENPGDADRPATATEAHAEHDSFVLRGIKWIGNRVIRFSLNFPVLNLAVTLLLVGVAGIFVSRLDRDFMPPFNEGAIQLNVLLPPGTSLATSIERNLAVERRLLEIEDIDRIARRTGRAELDEHAEPVSASEYIIELDPESHRSREEQIEDIRNAMKEFPDVVSATEGPIAHLITHMLSGVKAQIGIKVYGDNLDTLRRIASQIEAEMKLVPGVEDLFVEQQVTVPQLRIEFNREQLLLNGLSVEHMNEFVETALNGVVVSSILEGQRTFDLVVRMDDRYRENLAELRRLSIETPDGGRIPLESVANIYDAGGPNTINRENVQRRIVIQCNVSDRGLVDVVDDIRKQIQPIIDQFEPGSGYFVEFGGQFEAQQSASRMLGMLFLVSLVGVFMVLFTMFKSVNLSLQVMAALPMAFIGSVIALVITGQNLTVASMVGFISLGGIASRNGILLINHYLHLVKYEGEGFTHSMIIRAGLERLGPVLMTALTSGICLIPLVLSAGEPGKEILYPVATVILGGLISSTLLDFFVHPALFWLFGMKSAQAVMQHGMSEVVLIDDAHQAH